MFERERAAAMVAPGKGILVIDDSSGTIKNRFDVIGVESKVENRRAKCNSAACFGRYTPEMEKQALAA